MTCKNKDKCKKACQQLKEHKCQGVVPNTLVLCGEDDYQYCSEACLKIAKVSKDLSLFVGEKNEKIIK